MKGISLDDNKFYRRLQKVYNILGSKVKLFSHAIDLISEQCRCDQHHKRKTY